AKNLLRLNRFVPRTALGVQESQQFAEGFRIRGVAEKCALTLHPHQSFALQLVKMVRESGAWNVELLSNLADKHAVRMGRQQEPRDVFSPTAGKCFHPSTIIEL